MEFGRQLSYLGTATIRQQDVKAELSCALYAAGDDAGGWFGRYWDPNPPVALRIGPATLRFHDATDADVEVTCVAPNSGAFRVAGPLRELRKR